MKSAARAREKPAPTATPSTAAMTGFSMSINPENQSWKPSTRLRPAKAASSPASRPPRSKPEQTAPPAPVNTTERTERSSRAAFTAAGKAWLMAASKALRFCGRFSVMSAVLPIFS
ncbi:hypothetical protein D3C72_1778990 [compost metagenome]